jgi:phosphatidylserine decarboxylase
MKTASTRSNHAPGGMLATNRVNEGFVFVVLYLSPEAAQRFLKACKGCILAVVLRNGVYGDSVNSEASGFVR